MATDKLRVLVFGAHPDDCDFKAAGVAALYTGLGHSVKMVSVTNGDAGHQTMGGAPLAWRRRMEAQAAGQCVGAEYVVLDNHDGELLPTLENRRAVIRLIRSYRPHLILAPRLWDYHPDHRATAQLVQDAVYLLTVPNAVSDAYHMRQMPVVAYVEDHFRKPVPFAPDVVVAIDEVVEKKVDALACHVSQMYEWLPYNREEEDQVPESPSERRAWLRAFLDPRFRASAEAYRAKLAELYGEQRASQVKYAEAFEISEYGEQASPEDLRRLFPFFE